MSSTTKHDLIVAAAAKSGLSQKDCTVAFDTLLSVLTSRLSMGRDIEIRGFAAIYVHHDKGGVSRNPRTGEAIPVPAYKTVKMKFPKGFLDANM